MLEISVKTLDGQTRKFSVPDDMTVADFKERIAEPVNIPAARQRVIFQGRLLTNESRLGDLDLNGRAVHVVERTPPTHQPEGQQQQPQSESHARGRPDFIMAGAFEVPADIQQVVQQAVNQFGPAARGASVETRRMPGGAPGLEVHIRLPPPGTPAGATGGTSPQDRQAHEVSERIRIANKMLNLAGHVVSSLENESASGELFTPEANAQPATSATLPAPAPFDPEVSLAATLANISAFSDRLKPLLDEFSQRVLTRSSDQPEADQTASRQRATRLAQAVPEVLHHVAHAFHNLSDLVIDPSWTQPAQTGSVTTPATRIAVSSSTATPVQGVGVYQQVFTVPVVEIQTGGHNHQQQQQPQQQPQQQQQSSQESANNEGAATGPRTGGQGGGPFIFAQRMPGQIFNPFNIPGFFPRPPVSAVITNARTGQQAAASNQSNSDPNAVPPNMVRPIDQNLPCLSRHFLAPHVIEAARLSSQNAAMAAQQQQQQQQQGGQQPPQHGAGGVDPANMMNMFQDITNFVMQAIVQAGAQGAQQQQQANPSSAQQNRQQQQDALPADFLNSIQQLAGNVPATEPFGQIVRSLGQLFADPSGSASRTSAFDFIQGLGNVPPMAPSPINNLIELVMRALPMSDFIRLIMGDTTPLARVHAPVREHLISAMRTSDSPNGNVSVVVEAIISELRAMYDFVFTETETRDNIDLAASMIAHDRHWITRVVNLVLDTQPPLGPVENANVPLYRQIYDTILNAVHEAVVLIVTAIGQENARPAMRRLVQRAVANMEQGGQVESQSNFAVTALSDFADRLIAESPQRVPRSQIERFIVRRSSAPSQVPPAPTATVPLVPVSAPVVQTSASPSSAGGTVVDVSWVQPDAQERARANVLMTNHVAFPSEQPRTGDWRSVVPAEWVPVIEEDAAKQRTTENASQPALSDAYLSGLPAKRRRMAMEQRANDAIAQGQLSRGFTDILGQAVRTTGIPPTVAPALMEEATSSQELGSLFEGEVLRHLRARLSSDPNFDPARYPDITSFFNNHGRSNDSS